MNAALCIIHDSGADAQAVTKAAQAIIAQGHPATYAYESVLNGFAAQNATIGSTIGKVTRLIHSSTPESVAQYDHALSAYIDTGNNSAMLALAPMIATDSVTLAIRNGEVSEADIASGGFASVLGGEPTDAMQFAFSAATTASPAPEVGAKQVSAAGAGSGITAPHAQADRARWGYTGFTPDASPFQGLTPAATREAARSRAAGEGQGYIPAAPVADAA